MFNKIVIFVRKYFVLIFVIVLLLLAFVPFIVNSVFCRKITADGIIAYIVSIFGTMATLFTAVVSIYNSNKAQEANDVNRRMLVAPDLFVEIVNCNDEYEITISNDSDYSVKQIYIYDEPFITYIKGKGSIKKHFVINNCFNSSVKFIPKCNFNIRNESEISELELFYQDIDGRIIQQRFYKNDQNGYISDEQIYL